MGLIKRDQFIFKIILLGIVVFYSLGNTLQYYFYTDDYAFLYYLRNDLNFGWPYNSVLSIFRPVYQVFGINPIPYFSLALISYFVASIFVYFFAKSLTKNNLVAYLSSLIFATGYIGVDQFTMIAVSIVNNLNVINVSLTLITLIQFIRTRKIRYYFLTLIFFWISFTLFPYRAYPLVLFLPTMDLIMSFRVGTVKKMIRQIVFLIGRYIPFVLLSSFYGVFSYGTFRSNSKGTNLFSVITDPNSNIYTLLKIDPLKELFAVIGKFVFIKSLSDFFKFNPDQNFYSFIGIAFTVVIVITSLILFRGKNSLQGRSLLILLFFTVQGYVGNMFLNIDFDSNGTMNRYLTISFISFAILIPLFFFVLIDKLNFRRINKKWLLIITSGLVIISFSSLSRKYEHIIIKDRSRPAKIFFKELKTFLPQISDSTYNVFYFDRASYYPISSRFGTILLSAALGNSVNLALPYNASMDSIKIVDTFEQFLRYLVYPPIGKKVSYHTFYDDEKGLHDTTKEVFSLLQNGSLVDIPNKQITYDKNPGSYQINIVTKKVSSLTPLKIKMTLLAAPLDFQSFKFPYSFLNGNDDGVFTNEKIKIFEYLLSRERYYKTANVSVESIHIAKNSPAAFLIDDNPDSFWLSDQSSWEVDIKPWIKVDLSSDKLISRVIWRQLPYRAIDGFSLSTSLDGNLWTKVNNLKQKEISSDNTLFQTDFNPVVAHFIKFTINSLKNGPGPGLSEIEVVEDKYKDIDVAAAFRIKDSPFEYIPDENALLQTYEYLKENAKLKIRAVVNRDDSSTNFSLGELPISLDGEYHQYEFELPQGGTELKTIRLEANFPANFSVESLTLQNKTKDEMAIEIRKKCQQFVGVPAWQNPFDCK